MASRALSIAASEATTRWVLPAIFGNGIAELEDYYAPVERVAARLESGEFDDGRPPARIHGDLWAGNVLWTREGAVLIDPAAHGGHAETDLAMLLLFTTPHIARIIAAYDEAAPLTDGWQERVGLHQLFPVMVHAILFGGGYVGQAAEIARTYA